MTPFKVVGLVIWTATWLIGMLGLVSGPRRPTTPQFLLAAYLTALLLKQSASAPFISRFFATEVAPAAAVAVDRVLTLAEMYFLVALFLLQARMSRRAVWEVIPPLVAGIVAANAVLTAPPKIGPPSPVIIKTALYRNADVDAAHALWFVASDHLYIAYGMTVALYAAWRALPRLTSPTIRRGLAIASVSLLLGIVFGAVEQLVSVALRVAGTDLPSAFETFCYIVASTAAMLTPVGLVYPRVARWWMQRQTLLHTHYLWLRLFAAFPDTASMGEPPSQAHERRTLRGLSWRALRRRTDIRDALRELGPWVSEDFPPKPADQGPLVRDALLRIEVGDPPLQRAETLVIAAPANDSDEADEAALIALSTSLRTADQTATKVSASDTL